MRIAYYMPFKPLGHPNPSGDLIIGSELFDYLRQKGHRVDLVSRWRTRWVYWKPWALAAFWIQMAGALRQAERLPPEVWMTYHSYYKAPDVLGPSCAQRLGIPYVIYQGIYATKYRRRLKTLPGFWLNRRALLSAKMVISNKRGDYFNLQRIVPERRLMYLAPGIRLSDFHFSAHARQDLRRRWQVGDVPVVMTAAMFRPGVKTEGLVRVIEACAGLWHEGCQLMLVIAGDGIHRGRLQRLAGEILPGRVLFLGRIPRRQLFQYYSAADLFAFPGIGESFGMVYLEAQACRLPVVAHKGWGAAEAVAEGRTGLLAEPEDRAGFADLIRRLVADGDLRRQMGQAARAHVERRHDLEKNHAALERVLFQVAREERHAHPG
jgi:glycosyltransferase involved in cell wall biosynthesis